MKFEHLIEVNDLSNPLQELLTREELWFGLLCRAEDSRAFLPGLEACRIVERGADALVRDLHFGNTVIRDRVSFSTLEWICFESEANDQHAGGSLTIRIEGPQAGRLFLRFTYGTSFAEPGDDPEAIAYVDYIRAAYHAADLDTLAVIRELAMARATH